MGKKAAGTSIKQNVTISFLAGLTVFLTFLTVHFIADIFEYGIILASLGATAFLVFVYPEQDVSRSKKIVGGYALSSLSGGLAHLLLSGFLPLAAALSVGLSTFVMLLLGFEHPPASGIALSFALYSLSLQEVVSIMVGITLFLVLTELLRRTIERIRKISPNVRI